MLAYPETIMDRVRVGIAQYGYWPSKEIEMQIAAVAGKINCRSVGDILGSLDVIEGINDHLSVAGAQGQQEGADE